MIDRKENTTKQAAFTPLQKTIGLLFKTRFPRHITPAKFTGSRVGAVVRALASHQCVPGSIPGPGVICGLSLLLVLVLARKIFFGFSGFPSSSKINISKFDRELEGNVFVSLMRLLCVTLVKKRRIKARRGIRKFRCLPSLWHLFKNFQSMSSAERTSTFPDRKSI